MDLKKYAGKKIEIMLGTAVYGPDKQIIQFVSNGVKAISGVAIFEGETMIDFEESDIPTKITTEHPDITRKHFAKWELDMMIELHNRGMSYEDIQLELQRRDSIRPIKSIQDAIYRIKHNIQSNYNKIKETV